MPELLVSVRAAAEAAAALAGGAAVIDVKEPSRGPLGRADAATVAAVVGTVAGRRPVSAARGELAEDADPLPADGLAYVKWGLAGLGGRPDWRGLLLAAVRRAETAPGCRAVAVAYADWEGVQAPPPAEVCAFACAQQLAAFLLDTGTKDGRTLLDWLPPAEVGRLCRECRRAGVRVALAGSLGPEQLAALRPAEPDWFAVRGAACRGGDRRAAVDVDRVRRLVDLARRKRSIS
jgi:uncharacterized protein (UPF0264 family)